MEGWIKLHRQLLEWEWYDEPNTFRLFIHCLLKANHKGKKYRGDIINAGTFYTSRDILSKETGLTTRQVRTSLNKLKTTNELTIKSSRKGTVIQVVNYNKYQVTDQQNDQRATNERPTNDQRATSNKNDKNVKNDNKEYIKEKRGINSFDREEVKKQLLSEVNLKNLAATLEKGVTLNGGNFKLYPDTIGRIKSQFNNFMYVLSLKDMMFTDVNHIKNYFRIFLEKYWNVNQSEDVVYKMNKEFRKQSYKK